MTGVSPFCEWEFKSWKEKRGQVSLILRRDVLDFADGTHETQLSGR